MKETPTPVSAALTVGPDSHGRTVHIVDGRVTQGPASGAPVLACRDGEITPGLVNAHTHLYSGLAGLGMPAPQPAPKSFLQILERVWWRLDRALDASSLRAAARLAVAEALLSGTTTLIDHHESPDMIEGSLDILAESLRAFGARGLLCYGVTERNQGRTEALAGLGECARFIQAPRTATVRGMVGLHASFTVSDRTIRDAAALCQDLAVPLHVHVAEDRADVDDARQRKFPGPLERLALLGCLPPGSILAHGVKLSMDQVRLATARRCWWVHNPRSNEGNGVGFAAALTASDRVAMGTDGWVSDMLGERAAAIRLGLSPALAQARLDAGAVLVAQHFAAAPKPLSTGALGDLLVRKHGAVQHVVVEGRVVVENGALLGGNIDAVRSEARRAAPKLWERMAALPTLSSGA